MRNRNRAKYTTCQPRRNPLPLRRKKNDLIAVTLKSNTTTAINAITRFFCLLKTSFLSEFKIKSKEAIIYGAGRFDNA